jgi:hypothetical protein
MYRSQSCLGFGNKIYGLVGIPFSDNGLHLPADCSMTLQEIYKAAAMHILNTNGSLDLIYIEEKYMCDCIHSKHLLSGLPSWVTDWSCLGERTLQNHYLESAACLILKINMSQRINNDVLTCTVLVLGSVNFTQRKYLPHTWNDQEDDNLLGFL